MEDVNAAARPTQSTSLHSEDAVSRLRSFVTKSYVISRMLPLQFTHCLVSRPCRGRVIERTFIKLMSLTLLPFESIWSRCRVMTSDL